MNQKHKLYLSIFFITLLFILPVTSFAQDKDLKDADLGLVPCDNSAENPCNFNALMNLVDTIIQFILFNLAVPIAAIMFFYAGFAMVTSGGSSESRTKAKSIFSNTVIGLILVAASWLLVRTLLHILGYDGDWIGF